MTDTGEHLTTFTYTIAVALMSCRYDTIMNNTVYCVC